jgi:ferric-dicitrate binding protein FerR (iron transport regulator)
MIPMPSADKFVRPPFARTRSAGSVRLVAIALALALLSALVLALGSKADSKLSFELRGGSSKGGLIEAARGEATVALSDGSGILAENGTKFRVDVLGRNATVTRLVAGKLHVRVEHHDGTSYRFIAGPYDVRVVGTEFELAWDPLGAGLALSMSKGELQLRSPTAKPRTLKAGQSLQLPGSAS